METLRRTVGQLCPLVLPLKQRSEMEHGPTLLAHVSFTSMLTPYILTLRDSIFVIFFHCSVFNWSADCYPSLMCCSVFAVSVCVSNGRAVHYNGSSLLQWKSVRLDVALLPGEMGDSFLLHI